MKKFTKVSVTVVAVSSALILMGPLTAFATAATAPNLGTSVSFSVLGGGAMTSAGSTTISGDLGDGIAHTGSWTVLGTDYDSSTPSGVLTAATAAYTSMNLTNQPSGTTWDPAANLTPAAGLWTNSSNANLTGTLHLNGTASDVWIFQISDNFTFAGGADVVLGAGVNPCNVFWYITSSATITGTVSTKFVGTLIANSNVTLNSAIVTGRIMALTGTLATTGTTNITNPTCTTAVASVGSVQSGTIKVVKTVINDNGGTKTVADFPLFVNGIANGHQPVVSGETNTFFTFGLYPYIVTETSDPNYTATFSGDCDANGFLNLVPGDHKTCTITNNDKGVPPALPATITVVKKVINDNGGTRTVASFPLSVSGTPVVSGGTNVFPVGTYTVNEIGDSNYTRTFSGDCNSNGVMNLVAGDHKTCTITNTYQTQTVTTTTTTTITAPELPNTGLPPQSRTQWDIFISAGILMVVSSSLVLVLKKRIV